MSNGLKRGQVALNCGRGGPEARNNHKSRDKSKDTEKAAKERTILKWIKENKEFISLLDALAFEMWKDTRSPIDTDFVRKLLAENGYKDLNFTAGELLKIIQRGPLYSKKRRKKQHL